MTVQQRQHVPPELEDGHVRPLQVTRTISEHSAAGSSPWKKHKEKPA